jgi:hypothetical protein
LTFNELSRGVTTARYTQVATTTIRNVTSPLDHLIGKIKKDEPPA